LLLDQLRNVEITPSADGESAMVEVGAGCNLGFDRYDPAGISSWSNSLTHQLDARGFALSSLGGISHQTVAGFLSTGSAGGSLAHDLGSDVEAIELVDGRGQVHRVRRDASDRAERELFEAAGVSMGLLGVITRVWFRAIPSYDIRGREVTHSLASSPVDLLSRGRRAGLEDLFRRHDYSRALWWPQPGFDRVQTWTADRVERRDESGLRPFEILGRWDTLFGSLLQTMVGNAAELDDVPAKLEQLEWFPHLERALRRVARGDILHRPDDGEHHFAGLTPRRAARASRLARFALRHVLANRASVWTGAQIARQMPRWVGPLTSLFVEDGEKSFIDRWHLGLPMDNQLDDKLWPTAFAELWVPLDRALEVMQVIHDIVRADGEIKETYRRVSAFPIELYPGPSSRFWLSPGYAREGLRVNPCRFLQWQDELFRLFLDALRPFDPRPHWGKHLPAADDRWLSSLRRQLPRLPDFLALRKELDPDDLFLTDYWRANLGITQSARSRAVEPMP
jgi:hypothetical protein